VRYNEICSKTVIEVISSMTCVLPPSPRRKRKIKFFFSVAERFAHPFEPSTLLPAWIAHEGQP
jgi:hypothetical protein